MGASVVDKISPFSTPTKSSSKLTNSSVEAKENCHTRSLGNQMKSSTKKNFMSPTISAASKTVAHRKIILAERNGSEATEPTCAKFHRRRSSSFDLKQGSVDLGASTDSLNSNISGIGFHLKQCSTDLGASTDSLTPSTNEMSSVEDGEDAIKVKPYDPVVNYCSPRPKFLLYKPDRRTEILRRYEMIDSTSSESESSGEHEECLVKQNGEGTKDARENINHKEEVFAQDDEDAGGSVEEITEKIEDCAADVGKKGEDYNEVLTNIEEHKEVYETESVENHWMEIKKDHVQDVEMATDPNMTNQLGLENRLTTLSRIKNEALQVRDGNDIRIQSIEMEDEDEEDDEFEEESKEERCWSFKRLLKIWLVIVVVGLSTLYLSSLNSVSGGYNGNDQNVSRGLYRDPFIHGNASGSIIQVELAKMGHEEASHRIKDEIITKEPDNDYGETTEGVDEMNNEGSHAMDLGLLGITVEDKNLNIVSTADNMDFSSTDNVIYHVAGTGNASDIVGEEFVHVEETATPDFRLLSDMVETENPVVVTELVDPLKEASDAAANVELDVLAGANYYTEVTVDETAVFEGSSGGELGVGGAEHATKSVADGILNNLENVEEESETISTPVMVDDGLLLRYFKETDMAAIIGVVSSLLLAFVGFLVFQKLKRTNKPLQDEAVSTIEQDAIRKHHVKQVDNFEYSAYSTPGAHGFNSSVGAPRVELLGEYTFGENDVSSYSLRTDYLENYNDSTNSFSLKNMKISPSQPAVSGFSSTTETPSYGAQSSQRRSLKKELPTSSIDSPSYGSFTTEMMIRKKEEARGGEKIIVTPVRRSSRIQSRMTPGASQ